MVETRLKTVEEDNKKVGKVSGTERKQLEVNWQQQVSLISDDWA